jgi:cytochrome c553
LLIAAALVLISAPGAALANNGPHGGYLTDTDACAGCHRAHTAPSSITWVDQQGAQRSSALLLSSGDQAYLFCLACHDSTGQGADTNVLDGTYEGSAFGTQGADLISGPFGRVDATLGVGTWDAHDHKVTSTHSMNGESLGAWGGGIYGSTSTVDATGNYAALLGTGARIAMDCSSCHDPHGTSNYRLLKDAVYGVNVGGYAPGSSTDPTPTPFVRSAEVGFPIGGFRLHATAPGYLPNYTKPQYAKPPGLDPKKGLSGWCVGCHTVYMTPASSYNASDTFGFVMQHRHPVNIPLSTFVGPYSLIVTDNVLPLMHDPATEAGNVHNTPADWMGCLTCHNAHGASTVMTGWANVADPAHDLRPDTGTGGIPPTNDSALLKLNSRGVCEACHGI